MDPPDTPLQINGQRMNDFPLQYACEHLRRIMKCTSGICFANYNGSGSRKCSNKHCRGHRSKDDPPCLGGPPVMRLSDITAVKERLQRAKMQAEIHALEKDQVADGDQNWGNHSYNQQYAPQAPYPYSEATANASIPHTPIIGQYAVKDPANTNDEEETIRRIMALSFQKAQQPKPPTVDKELEEAILASQSEPQRPTKDNDAFDNDMEAAIRASQQNAPPERNPFDDELAAARRASAQEPHRLPRNRNNFDNELEEAIRRSQRDAQWGGLRIDFVKAAPSRPPTVIATPTVAARSSSIPTPVPIVTRPPPVHFETAPAILHTGERDPDDKPRERAPLDLRTVSPVHHEGWNKWNTTDEAKKWDNMMAQQDSNYASGDAPAYTPWAQKGEKTAEFDAATDEVKGWQNGFDAEA